MWAPSCNFKSGTVKTTGVQTDSARIVKNDSLKAVKNETVNAVKKDTSAKITMPVQWQDTVALLRHQLSAENKIIDEYEKKIMRNKTASDSAKSQHKMQFAKLLESMKADEAAKVLANMKDQDVKEVLLNVKARQASKILGMLEPKRAARLMN